MNVLLASDYFPPHVGGGVEQVTYHVAEELTKLGHTVAVLTLNTANAIPIEEFDGIRVYRAAPFEFTNALGVQSAVSTEVVNLMRKICRAESPEVVHANNLFFYTTLAACLNKMPGAPLVTTLHIGPVSELEGFAHYAARLYERSLGRWILAKSDHIVAVSEAVQRYAEEMGVNPSKISVVPNAVDTLKFHPSSTPRKRDSIVNVGFVGRLVSNKGPQLLIEAVPQIIRNCSNVQFQIVGQGPMLKKLQQRARQLSVEDVVRFLGNVPSMVEFLQSCDIVVRPSLTDGMPLTVLESMACGIPTVASRVGGTPEILQDGYTGYLVEPRSIDQLASRVSSLTADSKLRAKMGSRARRFVERYYSWKRVAERVVRVYESTIAG